MKKYYKIILGKNICGIISAAAAAVAGAVDTRFCIEHSFGLRTTVFHIGLLHFVVIQHKKPSRRTKEEKKSLYVIPIVSLSIR